MDFVLTPDLLELQQRAVVAADDLVGRRTDTEESWILAHDPQAARTMAELGWIGMTWPTAYGGGGRPPIERFIVFEQMISRGAPIGAMYIADRQMGPSILAFGNDEQKQRWLPSILDGSSMWCIGMSEPDNGSDLATLRTKAELCGDHWIVNGQKIWTSGAVFADWIYLVARTGEPGSAHAGLSEFVVDMRSPGVDVRPIRDATGNSHFCEVHLEDVHVPNENQIGELNGSFRQLMRQLEHERGAVDRLVTNRRLLTDLVESGIIDTSAATTRQRLAELHTTYSIGRLLVMREASGQAPKSFSAGTKTYCANYAKQVGWFCAEVLGARAVAFDPSDTLSGRVARAASYASAYTIMGGTDEVLRNILGERVLGLPRS